MSDFTRTRNPKRALVYGNAAAANEAAEYYLEDTGRRAEVRPFRAGQFRLVDVADEQFVRRNTVATYTFPGRSRIITEHEPITACDYVDGRFSDDIREIRTFDDASGVWYVIQSARRLPSQWCEGVIELMTDHGAIRVSDDFVVFGVVR